MNYAVNIADLMGADFAVKLLVNPVLDTNSEHIFNAEPGRFDGMASRLVCSEERAEAIVEIIRQRVPKHKLRFYQSKTGNSWERV